MKKYTNPELELIQFRTTDPLIVSGDPSKVGFPTTTPLNPVLDDTNKSLDQGFDSLVWNK